MAKTVKTFEEAIIELEYIVEKLENGDILLDESIKFYQKGIELSKFCNKKLDEAERKITILVEDEKGSIKEELFEIREETNELWNWFWD